MSYNYYILLQLVVEAVKNISSASPSSHQKLKNYYDGCVNYDKLVTIEERKTQGT